MFRTFSELYHTKRAGSLSVGLVVVVMVVMVVVVVMVIVNRILGVSSLTSTYRTILNQHVPYHPKQHVPYHPEPAGVYLPL